MRDAAMAIHDYTKTCFAETLQEIMREKDLEDVRVNDLCTKTGTQRGTFYHHFKDKYDLVSWIFMKDQEQSFHAVGGVFSEVQLALSLQKMWKKRAFYIKAFNDHSQNTLYEYIQEYDVSLLKELVLQYLGTDQLTQEQLFVIKYHSYGCLGYTIEWLKGKIPVTPEELAHIEFQTMPQLIKDACSFAAVHGKKRGT